MSETTTEGGVTLTLSAEAAEQVRQFFAAENLDEKTAALRVSVMPGGCSGFVGCEHRLPQQLPGAGLHVREPQRNGLLRLRHFVLGLTEHILEVRTVPVGPFQANCFLARAGEDVVIIDPGAEPDRIASLVDAWGVPGRVGRASPGDRPDARSRGSRRWCSRSRSPVWNPRLPAPR